jgi:hypothetical protein
VKTLVVASLLAAWAALLAISPAQASTTVDQVDIIDGMVDVNEDGMIRSPYDDATNVILFFGNNAPVRVNIILGRVDVTQNGSITTFDDLSSFNLASFPPTTYRMDIIDGFVDVDQDGIISAADDATDIRLVKLPTSQIDQVDIIDGAVDANEDGAINAEDFTTRFLLGFDQGALIAANIGGLFNYGEVRVFVQYPTWYTVGSATVIDADLNDLVNSIPSSNQVDIHGHVDVTEGGVINTADDASDVKLVTLVDPVVSNVNIIDGRVDVTRDGIITTLDDLNNVLLLFDDGAPIRVDIIDGLLDVTENGSVTSLDDLPNTALARVDTTFLSGVTVLRERVDIIDGRIDVDENGDITTLDDVKDVQLLVP